MNVNVISGTNYNLRASINAVTMAQTTKNKSI